MYPLLVGQSGPDVVRLSDDTLVRGQDNLGALRVQVQSSQDQNKPTEASEALH